jgi:hypothetical protein
MRAHEERYRHERARRALRRIGEQAAKAEKATGHPLLNSAGAFPEVREDLRRRVTR